MNSKTAEQRLIGVESETVIIFADIIGASEISNNVKLEDYALIIRQFHDCARNLLVRMGMKEIDEFYECTFRGDELCVMFHGACPDGDKPKILPDWQAVYYVRNALVFAISLKILWRLSSYNLDRINQGLAPRDIAIGINLGRLYRFENGGKIQSEGYAINLAKRIETASRKGSKSKYLCSELVQQNQNAHLLKKMVKFHKIPDALEIKGISTDIDVYEIADVMTWGYDLFPEFIKELFADIKKLQLIKNALNRYAGDFWNSIILKIIQEGRQRGLHELSSDYPEYAASPCQLMINQAKTLMLISSWDGAEILLRKIIDKNPGCDEALFYQGVVLEKKGLFNKAAERYQELAVKTGDNGYYCRCCRALILAGEYQKADDAICKAIALDDQRAEFYYYLALANTMAEKYDKAQAAFEKAIELKEEFRLASANYGFMLLLMDKKKEAEGMFHSGRTDSEELSLAELGLQIVELSEGNGKTEDITAKIQKVGMQATRGARAIVDIHFVLAIKYWRGVLTPKSLYLGQADLSLQYDEEHEV